MDTTINKFKAVFKQYQLLAKLYNEYKHLLIICNLGNEIIKL